MKKQKTYRGENTDNINILPDNWNESLDEPLNSTYLFKKTILLKQKKAQAHLEIIISFILFTTVIFIFFMLVRPFSNAKEIPADAIQTVIISQMTEEIGKLSVIVQSDNDCYTLTEVIDDYGSDFVEIQDSVNTRKYIILFSPMFSQSAISCTAKPGTDFNFGAYLKENFYTSQKINKLKTDYDENYQELKQEINIKNDFSFSFRAVTNSPIQDLTPDNPKKPPIGVNVIVKEFPVQVINDRGEIQDLILNLKVW